MIKPIAKNKDRRRYWIGSLLTIAWIVIWAAVIEYNWNTAKAMPLSEWGDFFAGIAGPIALAWIVLGYLQQGDDLKLNTDALKEQRDELKQQVAETRRIAEATFDATEASLANARVNEERLKQERLAMHLAAKPVFVHDGENMQHSIVTRLGIRNKGMRVTKVAIETLQNGVEVNPSSVHSIELDKTLMLSFKGKDPAAALPIEFRLRYTNAMGTTMYSDLRWSNGEILETLVDYQEDHAESYQ